MKISASFLKVQDQKESIDKLNDLSDYIHYDIMDGLFTPNKTLDDDLIIENTKNITRPKDIHLMVKDIKKYTDIYSKLNPEYITFHIEAVDNVIEIINYIKQKGIKVGIALNPNTNIDKIMPYLNMIDLVLVMSVQAGAGGQKFIGITDKINYLYEYRIKNKLNYIIEVDGGINNQTVKKVKKADLVVVGSYITNSTNYKNAFLTLRNAFTLAELMGVIVILGIIASIVTVTVGRNITNSRYTTCTTQEKSIIEAAKTWSIDNASSLPSSGSTSVTISALQSNGYLDDDLINPMTDEAYKSGTKVTITISGKANYSYEIVYDSTDSTCEK